MRNDVCGARKVTDWGAEFVCVAPPGHKDSDGKWINTRQFHRSGGHTGSIWWRDDESAGYGYTEGEAFT